MSLGWGDGGLEGDMGLEPRRADRPVAASESAGFAADGPPSPHPSTAPAYEASGIYCAFPSFQLCSHFHAVETIVSRSE